jgi:hypothetical protein
VLDPRLSCLLATAPVEGSTLSGVLSPLSLLPVKALVLDVRQQHVRMMHAFGMHDWMIGVSISGFMKLKAGDDEGLLTPPAFSILNAFKHFNRSSTLDPHPHICLHYCS